MLCIFQILSTISMQQPTPHRYIDTFPLSDFGERPIEEILEELGLLNNKHDCNSFSLEQLCEDDAFVYVSPLVSLSPYIDCTQLPGKEELHTQKNKDYQLLWNHAIALIEKKENLSKPLSDLPKFSKKTLATAAAEHKSYLEILMLLKVHNIPLDQADAFGQTPLEVAVNKQCITNVNYLIPLSNISSLKLLHKICNPSQDILKPEKKARIQILQTLLASKIDPNETNDQGNTVLELLLRHCAGKKDFWQTPNKERLHQKFLQQRKQMIIMLLKAGLDPQKTNHKGITPLALAHANPTQYNSELFEFLKNEMQKK